MEKEANTVSKSLQSLPLPDCQGKERREPRICTGGSLKAQMKRKKRFMSSDHGCSTSHLHPLRRLLKTCWCLSLETTGTQEVTRLLDPGSLPSRQLGEGENTAKSSLMQSVTGRTACRPDWFTWFELSKAKLRNHQMQKRAAVLDHQLRAWLRPWGRRQEKPGNNPGKAQDPPPTGAAEEEQRAPCSPFAHHRHGLSSQPEGVAQ